MFVFAHPRDDYQEKNGEVLVEKQSMGRGEVFRIDRDTFEEAQIEYEALLKERVVEDIIEKCLFIAQNSSGEARKTLNALALSLKHEYGL